MRGMMRLLLGGVAVGLLVGWGAVLCAAEPPATFDEAVRRAQRAWERLQEPDLKPEQTAALQAEALQSHRFALTHASANAKIEQLNEFRLNLAFLHWAAKNYYEAVVLGEFLARSYADRPEAQQAAKIALASYASLAREASDAEDRRAFDVRMADLAEFIAQRWPKSAAADEAWIALVRASLDARQLDKATGYLARISDDSPRRGETELFVGQSLWAAYLDAARAEASKRPPKTQTDKLPAQAQAMLEQGVGRLRASVDAGGEATYALAAAALSLAQISLHAGQPEKAVAWLDQPGFGPHALIEAEKPLVERGNLREETLKAAVRAYVAAGQLEKAQRAVLALEKMGGGVKLAQIYLNLGLQLETSWKRLCESGNLPEAAKAAKELAAFLGNLAAQPPKEVGFAALSWTADVFLRLAESVDSGDAAPPAEAAERYRQAVRVCRTILETCRAEPDFAPKPDAILGVRMMLARALRRLGKYEEALDSLVEVLRVQNNLIEAQREAARTYQAWGAEKPGAYLPAIRGGRKIERKDGSTANLVWGWGQIARKVQSYKTHQDIFHDARYNLALCRFRYAMSQSGPQRTDLLEQAADDVAIVYKLYPTMGGEQWFAKYDALLKKIQTALGRKPEGLRALDQQATVQPKVASANTARRLLNLRMPKSCLAADGTSARAAFMAVLAGVPPAAIESQKSKVASR